MRQDINTIEFAEELKGSLLKFIKYFFEKRTGRPFTMSMPDGRESHYITVCRELMAYFRLETKHLMINIPPGHGKSTMLVYFMAWCFTHYPDCRFLYISFSKSLAEKHTSEVKALMSMREYFLLFGVEIAQDSQAKGDFRTTAGGAVAAFGSQGSITGRDAGVQNVDRFSGAVMCFPYDEVVHTENGLMKIGDIVENKLNINVYSYNFETKDIELKPIQNWYENPDSDILEIQLDNGSKFECTPNHKIYTTNRGWIEAQYLLTSDNLFSPLGNKMSFYIKHFCNNTLLKRCIVKNIQLLFSKIFKFTKIPFWSNSISKLFPIITTPNRVNRTRIKTKIFSNRCRRFSGQSTLTYFNCIKPSNFSTRSIFPSWKCSVFNRILHIFSFRTINKIIGAIVSTVTIQMSSFLSFFSSSYKSIRNNMMNHKIFNFTMNAKRNAVISLTRSRLYASLKNFFRDTVSFWDKTVSIPYFSNDSFFTTYTTKIRNAIKSFVTRDRSPLLIRHINHANSTYCINVKDNHNFLVGLCKGILVTNCDDMHKPDEVSSDVMRNAVIDNYSQTIKPRPRGNNVGILLIGQRLHEEDLPAWLEAGKDGNNWRIVKLKSIDEAGNALAPNIISKEKLLIEKQYNPYVYSSQYQQEPVPASGGIFQREWFVKLDIEPKIVKTFITCDTAETEKTYNDASVFSFWGIYKPIVHGREIPDMLALHCLNAWEIRVEPKDLVNSFLDFWAECMQYKVKPSLVAIEKKSTGSTMVSYLKNAPGIRVHAIERSRASGSKTERFLRCQPFIANKLVSFPSNGRHTQWCIDHMAKVTANDTHAFDDFADTLADSVQLALIDKLVSHDITHDVNKAQKSALIMSTYNDISRLRKEAYYSDY